MSPVRSGGNHVVIREEGRNRFSMTINGQEIHGVRSVAYSASVRSVTTVEVEFMPTSIVIESDQVGAVRLVPAGRWWDALVWWARFRWDRGW